jgi:hypothetical protein
MGVAECEIEVFGDVTASFCEEIFNFEGDV